MLDPIEVAHAEQEADALNAATDLLDSWRSEALTIRGVTRSTYSLVANTQNYTIGSGGTFNQTYPSRILRWGVIPDDAAANPVEHPMGRPLNADEWALIRVKSTTGRYPTRLYDDRRYVAGLATLSVYPIQTTGSVDIVLYQDIGQLVSLVAATSYDLPPAFALAIKLNLALRLRPRYGLAATADLAELKEQAKDAKAVLKRGHARPKESPIRPDFVIGQASGRRLHNIYTDP